MLNSSPSYSGYNFTVGGNTIFFPAAGYRFYYDRALYNVGAGGYVWSAVSNTSKNGWSLNFNSGDVSPEYLYYRAHGFSVRPVQENN